MVVRMRSTRSHTANRRSHHALSSMRLSPCADCKALRPSHQVCPSCGKYRGKVVVDIASIQAKKSAKLKKRATTVDTKEKVDKTEEKK